MENSYLVYHNLNGECFPCVVCANRADAEELALAYAQEELYRRWFIDEQIAKPKGLHSIYTVKNKLINMNYNILEVPFVG
jgi:hypothetical protein